MITSFKHVVMGVSDAESAYRFYRDLLGFQVKLGDCTTYVNELKSIIGALVEMRIIYAVNPFGGAAVELVEHISTRPLDMEDPAQWGDIGFMELGLGAYHLEQLYLDLRSEGVDFITPVQSMELSSGGRERYAYLRDPDGTLIQLVEEEGGKRPAVGGVRHVAVGVCDMDKARRFYGVSLGFSEVIHESGGRLPELDEVTGGKEMEMVILGRRPEPVGAAAPGDEARIKLVYTPRYKGKPIFEGRRWGDIGLAEIGFDAGDLGETVNELIYGGVELLQAPSRADRGWGNRAPFAYLRDPDGGIIAVFESEEPARAHPGLARRALVWLQKMKSGAGS